MVPGLSFPTPRGWGVRGYFRRHASNRLCAGQLADMNISLLIGVGAGLASAVLYASAWTGTVLGLFVLFFLSPMPVAIAGLGWGYRSGALAAAVGCVAILLSGGLWSGVVYLIALGAPAAVFSYFALLNRTNPDGTVEWYPIGRIIMWASLWAAAISAAGMLTLGTDFASIKATMLEMLDKSLFANGAGPGGGAVTPEQKSTFASLMTAFMPWALATTWFTVAIMNVWAAGRVTVQSGMLTRPWPDLSSITLPPGMALGFGLAVIGMMAPDMAGLIASCFASALLFAFMLVGLGILHRLSRGYSIRPMILAVVYAGLLFMPPFANLIVAMIGLAEPFFRGRLPPGAGASGPPSGS